LAGKLLLSNRSSGQKLKFLIIGGVIGLVVGYALDPVENIRSMSRKIRLKNHRLIIFKKKV